jgi:ectoine hydroxylase-related dioxygenase (phytanoyl-CoA dioxygenase family)
VTPKTHDILLFPSDLTHQAEPNLSDKPRYSIAFNCFVKGKLGDLRDESQLNLQYLLVNKKRRLSHDKRLFNFCLLKQLSFSNNVY